MITLSETVYLICEHSKVHICVHDISGILKNAPLCLESRYTLHSKPFCDVAKSTTEGYLTCVNCKKSCNQRAILGESFSQFCPYGIYRVVRPVNINGKTKCIVYVGNICPDKEKLRRTAYNRANISGVDIKAIDGVLDTVEISNDFSYYAKLGDFIADLIIALKNESSTKESEAYTENNHWCVKLVCEFVNQNYGENLNVQEISEHYFISGKYLGRIFRSNMKMTFHQYLNKTRLKKSTELLLTSDKTILEIAELCGFNNVTYFNRVFKEQYRMTPTQYRNKRI